MSSSLLKNSTILVKVFALPLIFYILLIAIRIAGHQPTIEGELGDLITAINFLIGAFIGYFVFILIVLKHIETNANGNWWFAVCTLMCILAFDELFMIHEIIGAKLSIKDTFVFLFYGGVLGVLLLMNLKETFKKDTFTCLVIFAVMTIVSQGADFLYNEGTIMLMGREISYEQFLESFGALSLTCAVVTFAIREIIRPAVPTKAI